MKRIIPFRLLPIVGILIASLFASIPYPARGGADAAAPAPAETAAGETSPEDAKKAEAESVLLDMFKKESDVTNTLGMVFVWVKEGYRVGRFEVTQQQYQAHAARNPSKFPGPSRPVENVTWTEANQFCQQLTEKELKAGKLPKGYSYALPSEKQWEYFVGDATLEDAITSFLGDRNQTENVGGLGANKFGLFDVRGNVWEWCGGSVARGASWMSYDDYVFVPFRYVAQPDQRYDDVGFRMVLQGAPAGSK